MQAPVSKDNLMPEETKTSEESNYENESFEESEQKTSSMIDIEEEVHQTVQGMNAQAKIKFATALIEYVSK